MERRIIDYIYRGKVRRYAVNVPIDNEGFIRLDYTDINVNRVSDFFWTKFKPERLIKEYFKDDKEFKDIVCIWWLTARKYIKSGFKQGSLNIQKMYNDSVKEHNHKHSRK